MLMWQTEAVHPQLGSISCSWRMFLGGRYDVIKKLQLKRGTARKNSAGEKRGDYCCFGDFFGLRLAVYSNRFLGLSEGCVAGALLQLDVGQR